MGLGDEIMVTALTKKRIRTTGQRSVITDKNGHPRVHPVWENNDNIATPLNWSSDNISIIKNHSGHRHYIDHTASTPDRWVFKPWDIEPGEIFFDREEEFFRHAARPDQADVLLDPGVKAGRQNKLWPYANWQALSLALLKQDLIFDVNNPLQSTNIRDWLANLTRYRLIICHEGGLHHAAAALGIPCITLFGGFISPSITGYGTCDPTKFRDLTHAKEFCGMIRPCQHCKDEMMKITPAEVMEHVKELLHVR